MYLYISVRSLLGMNDDQKVLTPFAVRDCALVALATGHRAQNLRELRNHLLTCDLERVYYHFWGRLLRPRFDEPEYSNDFAAWAYRALDEKALAERLSVVNPADFPDLEELRHELVEIIDDRLDESPYVPWAQADKQFYFISAQIVIFDTGINAADPQELTRLVPSMSAGSIYYHFVDARRRTPERIDDFSAWLSGTDGSYEALREKLQGIDPYFSSLLELRSIIASCFTDLYPGAVHDG
jgi:hypothetical protein